ncbi:hypothetical protein GAT18_25795 [Phocaeicola vulgatus]|nr:hypothetical protein GAT18_25795 [Phocaeicola vulgatus]
MPCACAGPRRLCTRTPACGSGTGCSGAGGHGGLLSGAVPFADGGEAGGPGGLSRRGAGGVPLGSGGGAGGWPRRVHRLGLCGGRAVSGCGYPCGTVSCGRRRLLRYSHADDAG